MKTEWEDSRKRYSMLIEKLNALIIETGQTVESYKQINIDFAYHLYDDNLLEIMKAVGCYKSYGVEFSSIYKSLNEQVEHLKQFRDKIHLLKIKDSINFPPN